MTAASADARRASVRRAAPARLSADRRATRPWPLADAALLIPRPCKVLAGPIRAGSPDQGLPAFTASRREPPSGRTTAAP